MNSAMLSILLLTTIDATKYTEGFLDLLIKKWSPFDGVYSQHISPRCVRSCGQGADYVFWNDVSGHTIQQLSKFRFLEILLDEPKKEQQSPINRIRENIKLAIHYLDPDNNGFVSEEEFFTEFLCLGFELEIIRNGFNILNPGDRGIQVSHYIETLAEYDTEPNKARPSFRMFDIDKQLL